MDSPVQNNTQLWALNNARITISLQIEGLVRQEVYSGYYIVHFLFFKGLFSANIRLH